MIITLKNADFSKINIGTLSTWRIICSLGTGASYEGVTSVDRGSSFNATITIAEGYELGTAGVTVTMGGNILSSGVTVNGNTITIMISEVTGNVVIKVATVSVNADDDPVVPPDDPVVPPVTPTETVWYFDNLDEANLTKFGKKNQTSTGNLMGRSVGSNYLTVQDGVNPDIYRNKMINAIGIKSVTAANTIEFYKHNKTNNTMTLLGSVTSSSAKEYLELSLDTPVSFADDEWLIVYGTQYYYHYDASEAVDNVCYGFCGKFDPTSGANVTTDGAWNVALGVKVGYKSM